MDKDPNEKFISIFLFFMCQLSIVIYSLDYF